MAVNAGTLALAGTGTNKALGGATSITVNGGGTLLMGAANQLNATTPAALQLNGTAGTPTAATFKVGGFNQGSTTTVGVGALTLATGSTNDVLDFGGANGTVTFASLVTNGATLTINNYLSNGGSAGGPDELIFNQDEAANLGNIVFTNYGAATEQLVSGTAGTSNAYYEVLPAPVPEPTTLLGGVLLLGTAGWTRRRWLRALLGRRRSLSA